MDPDAQMMLIIFGSVTITTLFIFGTYNFRKMVEARQGSKQVDSEEVKKLRSEVQELRGAVHDLMLQVEMGEKPTQVADRLTPPDFNRH